MTKTVIIGANHAGIAAANTLLDNYQDQEVVMIDRNTKPQLPWLWDRIMGWTSNRFV